MIRLSILLVCAATLLLPLRDSYAAAIELVRVASGLRGPLYLTAPPQDTKRAFIVEKNTGNIRILNLASGVVAQTPFLTVPGLSTDGERGLLGLAFHPRYASNGLFYVYLTDTNGDSRIRRYRVSNNRNVANPRSATPVLGIAQPFGNHNGGWIGFGPDGYLYVATGDGGSGNDPGDRAQDVTDQLLGKILRINVNRDDFPADPNRNHAIPPGNPFAGAVVGGEMASAEIWAYGLRNPWRASFDRTTGDFYIGDVGQNAREEINVLPAGSGGGQNYGWRLREGSIATPTGGVGGPPPAGAVDPVYDYSQGTAQFQGNSVTGGYLYRGPVLALRGKYVFGDFRSSQIWSFELENGRAVGLTNQTATFVPDVGSIDQIASFGEDAAGNLYVIDLDGEVFRVEGTTVEAIVPALLELSGQ